MVVNRGGGKLTGIPSELIIFFSKTENDTSFIGFKLIALKILDKCDESHLNVLKKNKENIFYFEKAFEIREETIEYDSNKDLALYNIKNSNNINVNVTAIVGKNGSGKSSLIELLA